MGLDDELDRLYGLPLDEFTAARNELAKRLRRGGDAEGAERVRGLAKPSVAAWTVNQLVRRRPERVRTLLASADELRAAQERALAGGGGEELRSASQRERELVSTLRRDARELLVDAGRSPSDATLERVATTLSSAPLDPEARPLLEAGRLSDEVAASGFGAFAGMEVPADAPGRARERPSREDAATERRRVQEAKKRAVELRKRATTLEKQARRAEREAERAAGEAARARAAAEEALSAADEAEAELA